MDAKVLPPFETSFGCFVVKKDNTELLDALNAFIKDIQEDGTLTAISEKWVGKDISKDPTVKDDSSEQEESEDSEETTEETK